MTKVTLKRADERELDVVLAYVCAYHEFEDLRLSDRQRSSAIRPLLGESPFGRIFLICRGAEPIGYIAVCFGYSIEFQGRDAFIDEMFIGPEHRGKGYGREALALLGDEVRMLGVMALHLEVARDNERARASYRAAGFELRDKYALMSVVLDPGDWNPADWNSADSNRNRVNEGE